MHFHIVYNTNLATLIIYYTRCVAVAKTYVHTNKLFWNTYVYDNACVCCECVCILVSSTLYFVFTFDLSVLQ